MAAAGQLSNRKRAALCICAAVGLASTQDALVKWVSGSYPVYEVLLIRCAVAFVIVGALVQHQGGFVRLLTPHWPRVMLRSLVMCSAYLAFVLSIATIPIADAIAVYFTMPFFVAGLSWPVLGERVRAHRWLAIAAGFIGVMIMKGVSTAIFDPALLLALWSAFAYGLGQLMGRSLSRHVTPVVLAFHQNLVYAAVALLLAAVFGLAGHSLPSSGSLAFLTRPWMMPPPGELALMGLLGAIASIAMVLFGAAYKNAEASFVAPFEYTAMFWAVGYGVLLFGNLPDLRVALGGAVVVTAGLWMLWMDNRIRLAAQTG